MPVLPEISEVKGLRKKSGLTQAELAANTGVSQSLIAKIEAGKVVPSYDKAKKLFDFFERASPAPERTAAEFMSQKVVSAKPSDSAKDAAKTMKKHAVSQLPVIEGGKNLGTVSEETILEIINSEKGPEEAGKIQIKDLMAEAMPIVQKTTPYHALSGLLEHNNGALVAEKGRIIGIITKSDLLNAVIAENKQKRQNKGIYSSKQ